MLKSLEDVAFAPRDNPRKTLRSTAVTILIGLTTAIVAIVLASPGISSSIKIWAIVIYGILAVLVIVALFGIDYMLLELYRTRRLQTSHRRRFNRRRTIVGDYKRAVERLHQILFGMSHHSLRNICLIFRSLLGSDHYKIEDFTEKSDLIEHHWSDHRHRIELFSRMRKQRVHEFIRLVKDFTYIGNITNMLLNDLHKFAELVGEEKVDDRIVEEYAELKKEYDTALQYLNVQILDVLSDEFDEHVGAGLNDLKNRLGSSR